MDCFGSRSLLFEIKINKQEGKIIQTTTGNNWSWSPSRAPTRDTNLDPSRLDQCLQYVHFTFFFSFTHSLKSQSWNELNDDDVSFRSQFQSYSHICTVHKVSILSVVVLTKWSIIYETVSLSLSLCVHFFDIKTFPWKWHGWYISRLHGWMALKFSCSISWMSRNLFLARFKKAEKYFFSRCLTIESWFWWNVIWISVISVRWRREAVGNFTLELKNC